MTNNSLHGMKDFFIYLPHSALTSMLASWMARLGFFPNSYAATWNWTCISSYAPLLRDLNCGGFNGRATAAGAEWKITNDNRRSEVWIPLYLFFYYSDSKSFIVITLFLRLFIGYVSLKWIIFTWLLAAKLCPTRLSGWVASGLERLIRPGQEFTSQQLLREREKRKITLH